eukprot:gene21343-28278_t
MQVVRQLRVAPYDEVRGTGALRYIQLTAVSSSLHQNSAQLIPAEDDEHAQVQLSQALWSAGSSAGLGQGRGVLKSRQPRTPAAPATKVLSAAKAAPGANALSAPQPAPLLHSVWVHCNSSKTNNVMSVSGGWQLMHGQKDVWQPFGGTPINVAPSSFVQANFGAFQSALAAIRSHVPQGSRVTELHAGVGAIGLSLMSPGVPPLGSDQQGSPLCSRLQCVEINPSAAEPFYKSRRRLLDSLRDSSPAQASHSGPGQTSPSGQATLSGPGQASPSGQATPGPGQASPLGEGQASPSSPSVAGCTPRAGSPHQAIPDISYVVAAAGSDPDKFLADTDVVIVDPPRKGLEDSLLKSLCKPGGLPHTLIYLSCGFKALQRDSDTLTGRKPGQAETPQGKSSQKGSDADTLIGRKSDQGEAGQGRNSQTGSDGASNPMSNAGGGENLGPWRLVETTAFLFFPGTDSIETLAVFKRC